MSIAATIPISCRHQGIALVIVLWMLALLSMIAGSLVFASRTEILIAGNLASTAQAEAAADAGIYKAIHELVARPATDPQRWQGDGQTHVLAFGEATLSVTIVDESAKIDINTAPEALLRSLFVSLGIAEANADTLTDAIQDWRDADDLRRLHGAEKEDYAAAGRKYGPANTNFETIEELRQVLGMDERIYLQIESLITAYSAQAGINSAVAPRQVLLALPGATPEAVDAYLDLRRAALAQGQPAPLFPGAQAFGAGAVGSVFTVQTEAVLGDNTRFFREAVVRLAGNGKEPVTMLAWRTPAGVRTNQPITDPANNNP